MNTKEELNLILTLLRKYNLPLSPILEYAINEKIDAFSGLENHDGSINDEGTSQVTQDPAIMTRKVEGKKLEALETNANSLRVVNFGKRGVAVVGDTKSHRISLRAMGGYYMSRTVYGPAWIFPLKQQKRVQAYVDGDTSVVDSWVNENSSPKKIKDSSRGIIRVKYPDGRVFCSDFVWETLVDVIKYAGPERVKRLHITCMGDNLVSYKLNENPIYRAAQKSIGDGLYVCTYSSTETKQKQIERINKVFNLGLTVEKVDKDEKHGIYEIKRIVDDKSNKDVSIVDKRIGNVIRLFPSLLEGEIVRTKVDKNGVRKIVVRTTKSGNMVEIDDLPYLYEVIHREATTVGVSGEKVAMIAEGTEKINTPTQAVTINTVHESDIVVDNRKGKTWDKEEEKDIERYYRQGKDIKSIAETIGRTELAVKARLAKLGLIDYEYGQEGSQDDFVVEHVYLDNKGNVIKTEVKKTKDDEQETGLSSDRKGYNIINDEENEFDIEEKTTRTSRSSVNIGTRVRLLPSQIEGVVVNHLIAKSGEKRIVIKKDDGSLVSSQDHPYLYEKVKKKRKRVGGGNRGVAKEHEGLSNNFNLTDGNTIKKQFHSFLAWQRPLSTANSYTNTLDHAVREWIKREVDAEADSIFSYTTSEDVRLCIDMLKETPAFVNENKEKHNSMTAALKQYLLFIEDLERKKKI